MNTINAGNSIGFPDGNNRKNLVAVDMMHECKRRSSTVEALGGVKPRGRVTQGERGLDAGRRVNKGATKPGEKKT